MKLNEDGLHNQWIFRWGNVKYPTPSSLKCIRQENLFIEGIFRDDISVNSVIGLSNPVIKCSFC
jgi:hypothetical protein